MMLGNDFKIAWFLELYRRDFRNKKNGYVIVGEATYMNNFMGNEKYKEKDIKAIKRILNSLKFLDTPVKWSNQEARGV